jgi:hypothetical protein
MADDHDLPSRRVTGTVLAAVLGLTDRRLRQLRDEGHIQQTDDGDYELGPAVQGYARFLGSRKPIRDSEHAALARAQAEKVRRENLRARGLLQPVELVDETLQGVTSVVVSELEGIPGRLANELAGTSEPAVVRARLQDECRAVRTAVADYLERRADALSAMQDGGDDVAPAAEADALAVGRREPELPGGERGTGSLSQPPGAVVDSAAGRLCQPAL